MPGFQPLAEPANVVYAYDGSFQGFLCCVFESVRTREIPFEIVPEEEPLILLEVRHIATDPEKAERVRASIPKKISQRALDLVSIVFLSCLEQKENKLLVFLLRAYGEGSALLQKLGDPVVAPVLAAEKHLLGEAHLLKGFIRFSDVGGGLAAVITPKNFILPFLVRHFVLRYKEEDFIIFDKTHRAALIYRKGRYEIAQIEGFEPPELSEKEEKVQALWKRFYDTIAIEGRENPRCRMTHMPKRYWENMLEVKDLL